jgi:hypothetical protein
VCGNSRFGGLNKEICKVSANQQSKSAKMEAFMSITAAMMEE